MEKQAVMAAIRSAFSGVTLGDGIGLREAQAIDDYQCGEVREQQRLKDEKDDWSRLEHDVLQRCHSSLSFFDADGMRFHLPAYIVASLDNKVDDPLFHLTQLDDHARSKLTSLSRPQKQAIAMYLSWCLDRAEYAFEHPAIRRALDEYWAGGSDNANTP